MRRSARSAPLVGVVLLVWVGWTWQRSLVPETYSVMEMGYVDAGTPPAAVAAARPDHEHAHSHEEETVSVTELIADPVRVADVRYRLEVDRGRVRLASGRTVPGFTVDGTSPGPVLTATVGDLVEVEVSNAGIAEGAAVHWHGVDVPNAADGVAGVTQDAIGVGGRHLYRFEVDRPGTFWYHAHQQSHPQVVGGLLGALLVLPADGLGQDHDVTAVVHTYGGTRTINGAEGVTRLTASPGETARVRVVNTDQKSVYVWASAPVRLLAVDGSELSGPTPTDDRIRVPAAARVDLEVTVPSRGAVRVQLGASNAVVVGPDDAAEPIRPESPSQELDLLDYGTPAALAFDPDDIDRHFDYRIGRRLGFVDGRPGLWWSINGHLHPDVPMFLVRLGDVVRVRVENRSHEVHPMHLHGHRALLVSRNGKRSRGSPLWVDSFDVEHGETVEVVFLADNPGIWMNHCHDLEHAVQGLVAHVMYAGVSTPYLVGGQAHNHPE